MADAVAVAAKPDEPRAHGSLRPPCPAPVCCSRPANVFLTAASGAATPAQQAGGTTSGLPGVGLTIKLGDMGLGRYLSSKTYETFSMVSVAEAGRDGQRCRSSAPRRHRSELTGERRAQFLSAEFSVSVCPFRSCVLVACGTVARRGT